MTEQHADAITLLLPFPPSVNTYWRRRGNRHFIGQAGRDFISAVGAICANMRPISGRLRVCLTLIMPDRRERDVDNYAKSTLDALAKAGLFMSDNQIDELYIRRGPHRPPGACLVSISLLTEGDKHGSQHHCEWRLP